MTTRSTQAMLCVGQVLTHTLAMCLYCATIFSTIHTYRIICYHTVQSYCFDTLSVKYWGLPKVVVASSTVKIKILHFILVNIPLTTFVGCCMILLTFASLFYRLLVSLASFQEKKKKRMLLAHFTEKGSLDFHIGNWEMYYIIGSWMHNNPQK